MNVQTKQSTVSLAGLRALVTSGPTFEPIDPVRYLANRSSGTQGHAIAGALAQAGADVTLVSGPVTVADPEGVARVVRVETAEDMLAACKSALPVDIAVCAAAVCDWRVAEASVQKIKKDQDTVPPVLHLAENPDILATLSRHPQRPALVIGFAAETGRLIEAAREKRVRKGCDWMVANDVSGGAVFGQETNSVWLITPDGEERWPEMSKQAVADALVNHIATLCAAMFQREVML